MIKIASFNVENLFARPKAFRATNLSEGEPILHAYREVNELFKKTTYDSADRTRMRILLVTLDIYAVNQHGAIRRKETLSPRWAWLRKNRGVFDREPQDETKDVEIIAGGHKGAEGIEGREDRPSDRHDSEARPWGPSGRSALLAGRHRGSTSYARALRDPTGFASAGLRGKRDRCDPRDRRVRPDRPPTPRPSAP